MSGCLHRSTDCVAAYEDNAMRRTPVILQSEAAECGLACLAMVSGAHGHRMDLPAIRRYHSVSLKGTTLRDLIRVAHDLHLDKHVSPPS